MTLSVARQVPLQDVDVERALEAMRSGHPLPDHPLQFFLSIHMRLQSPHVLTGSAAVQVAIFEHLTDMIARRLSEVRRLYSLPPPDFRDPDAGIPGDFRYGNTELEAWSVLYHRYVCVDRNFSMQDIEERANQEERTLRRRHRLGITRLTYALIELEQETRRSESQRRLRLALPALHPPHLFGTESTLERAQRVLLEAPPPRHLVLHGPAGIGKTALAQLLAHSVVDEDRLDDLLWLDIRDLDDTQAVLIPEIASRLGLESSPETNPARVLRAYLFTHRVLIVLDGVETLLNERERAEMVLALLDAACVVLTSRVRGPDNTGLYQIAVPELTREQAFQWLDHLVEQDTPPRSDWPDRFADLWNAVGGNPLALRLLLHTSRSLPLAAALARDPIDGLYQQIWERLSAHEQRVLLLALLFPREAMPYDLIARLVDLDDGAINRALHALTNAAILTPHQESGKFSYSIQPVTRTFLIERVKRGLTIAAGEAARDFLQAGLRRRVAQLVENPQAWAALSLLRLARDLEIPGDERWTSSHDLAPQITQAGLWASWCEQVQELISEDYPPPHRAWLHLMMGTALRWTGHLHDARDHLTQSLDFYDGDSAYYAEALVELAVVNRYQGQWEDSYRLAQTALDIYSRTGTAAGVERCIHELAQLALEAGEAEQALAWMSRLEGQTSRTWGVISQAYLLLGRMDEALQAADQAWAALPIQHPNRGRAAATLGQIYDTLGESQSAVRYLLAAIDILEETKDIMGYARACNNLAVAYLKQPSGERSVTPDAIRRLLTQALRIQEHTGDGIGQAVTRQNLSWFNSVGGTPPEAWPY